MGDASAGKVVVNRAMSLDGFIAGPGDAMDWVFDYMSGGVEDQFPEIMAATGAMLIGRRTYEVDTFCPSSTLQPDLTKARRFGGEYAASTATALPELAPRRPAKPPASHHACFKRRGAGRFAPCALGVTPRERRA